MRSSSEITDDLLYHGDLNNALRRMMQSGFRDRNGERLEGIREMLEKLRRKRRDELERYDLGGVYDDIAQELREVVEQEREALDQQMQQARESGDQRRQETAQQATEERHMQLDMLPPISPVRCATCSSTTSSHRRLANGSRSCSTSSASSSRRATSTRWPAR